MVTYLVNPSERSILDNAGDRVPIGLLSIANNMYIRGHDVAVYDLNHDSESELIERVKSDRDATVGISVYTSPSYNEAVRLSGQLRPYARTVAGGHHATHMPETLTDHFDTVVRGEGEQAMIAALNTDGVIDARAPDLSKLPGPGYDFIDMSRYGVNQSGRRTGTIITSRGCPYSCAFCGKLENKVRTEPMENVKREIDTLKEKGFNGLYFLDDVFTLNKDRMSEITDWAYQAGMPFRVTTRANLIDKPKLGILADDGAEWLSLGIESGDNGILKRSNKGMTAEQNYHAVRSASKHGLKVKGFFIIGLPGESERSAKRTIEYADTLRMVGLTSADFYYLTPFPGTPIWNNPEKFGIEITDRDFTKYLEAGKTARCVVNTEELNASRIEELVQEAREQWQN